ncbi:hypothetical protein JR316_0007598 [Psilocybe cubensis]|uniref:Uncharacterized protein n=1 Tax=Psilocybe cubensis TaxID=181762 RepID=A0ACB8GU77_PSICU|nr:hypothetical protein JR316_0007598 [Psilocybe cubensis]KAH9479024.1 hypothetical protein JR316_0007598 [Psilocybe cubensis]
MSNTPPNPNQPQHHTQHCSPRPPLHHSDTSGSTISTTSIASASSTTSTTTTATDTDGDGDADGLGFTPPMTSTPTPGYHGTTTATTTSSPNTTALTAPSSPNTTTPSTQTTPIVLLRVRVVGCDNLLGKDRGGTSSDFFVLLSLPTSQPSPSPSKPSKSKSINKHATPTIKRTTSPTFPAPQSTFDLPPYMSVATE